MDRAFFDINNLFYESHYGREIILAKHLKELMPFALLLLSALTSFAAAQYSEQPLKESTSDLRSQTVLFSIEIPDDKKIYLLERTASEDYFLRLKSKGSESIKKVAGREATRLDREFASKFLRSQYEIAAKEGECEVTIRLVMKGEGQDICEKDDKKSQEFKPFVDGLSKLF